MAPIILGGIGMALGLFGLIFGMQGKSRAISVDNKVAAIHEEDGGSMASRLEALELQYSTVGTANNALADQVDGIEKALRSLTDQTHEALSKVGQAINENRRHIGGSSASFGTSSGGSRSSHGTDGTYVIQKGDNFWKIANRLGISSKALEAANPSINPLRLNIGQKIKLP